MGSFGAGGGRRSVSGFWRAGVASGSVAVWPCRQPRMSGWAEGTEKGLRPAGRSSLAALGSFRQALGRSAPCFVGATWRGSDPLVPDSHLGPFCRRFRSLFLPECGKDSAGDAARKGFRAERIHLEAHAHAKPWAWHPAQEQGDESRRKSTGMNPGARAGG